MKNTKLGDAHSVMSPEFFYVGFRSFPMTLVLLTPSLVVYIFS
jgi:hypothetical protein